MRFMVLAIILVSANVIAEERPIVRAEITPGTVAVGESVELKVTVLVPTWFIRPPIYPSFELSNAITRLPDDSSFSMRERIGKDSWSAIVRTYEILPLFGASYRLSGQSISLSYASPGSDPIVVDVEVPEVFFQGTVPAGAAALDTYIAGRSLKLSLGVEGETTGLEVGDALVLNYAADLDGLPAIFLPPLAPTVAMDGVSVYADSPVVGDTATARRSEKLTLVFDAGGEFVIPGITLDYWNTETESIDTVAVEGFTVAVAGPVVVALDRESTAAESWIMRVSITAGLMSLAYLIYAFGPVAAGRYRAVLEQRQRSEPFAFGLLLAALRTNNAEEAYRAMLIWMERLEPGMGVRRMAKRYGDESLLAAVDALSMTIYAGAGGGVDNGQLADSIASARERYLRQSAAAVEYALPPLNP